MKSLRNKVEKIHLALYEMRKDLFFQSLPEETKRDLYKSIDNLKTFIDNLPVKNNKN